MKTTIQIIDDNASLTTLLAKALSKFGYTPVVENNPLLAINTARHYLPDLILLDVMMPERDGGRVLADLRNDLSLRYIPVVLLTAIAREARALAETGGIESVVLSKPIQIKDLIDTIENQLAAVRTYSQQQAVLAEQGRPTASDEEVAEIGHHLLGDQPPAANRLPGDPGMAFTRPVPGQDDFPTEASPPVDFSFPERPDGEAKDSCPER